MDYANEALKTTDMLRKEWRTTIEGEGGHCPVCDRWGKIYTKRITKTMVKRLAAMARVCGGKREWVYLPDITQAVGLAAYSVTALKHWGLVEQRVSETVLDENNKPVLGDKKTSGFWRVTQAGVSFLDGRTRVPKYLLVYNDTTIDSSQDSIGVQECMGEHFNYGEMMAEAAHQGEQNG